MNRFERDFPPPGIRYYGEDPYEERNKPAQPTEAVKPFNPQVKSERTLTRRQRYTMKEGTRDRVVVPGTTGKQGIERQSAR